MSKQQASIQEEPCTTTISFSRSIYDKDAIISASYNISNKYSVIIDEDGLHYLIDISTKSNSGDQMSNDDIQKFLDDVIDHQLRLQLEQKTAKLREIIVEHAFKPIDDLHLKIAELAS